MLTKALWLSWWFGLVGGIIATLMFVACLYWSVTYQGSNEELLDRMRGIKATWPVGRWFLIALLCWSWVFIAA